MQVPESIEAPGMTPKLIRRVYGGRVQPKKGVSLARDHHSLVTAGVTSRIFLVQDGWSTRTNDTRGLWNLLSHSNCTRNGFIGLIKVAIDSALELGYGRSSAAKVTSQSSSVATEVVGTCL